MSEQLKRFCDCDHPDCTQCKTDAFFNKQITSLQRENAELKRKLALAESAIADSKEQKPVAMFQLIGECEYQQVTVDAEYIKELNIDMAGTFPLYASPPIQDGMVAVPVALMDEIASLLKDGAEPNATQADADVGMVTQWDVDVLRVLAMIEASKEKI